MKFIIGLSLAAAIALAPAATAEKWAISAIKYKNNGAYTAYFNIESRGNVSNVPCEGKNTRGSGVKSGKSLTIQLDNSDNSLIDSDQYSDSCLPILGHEVWGVVYIDRGSGYSMTSNRQNCRKDGNKFYYDPKGGTLTVETRGTTENGNRCQLNNKGGVKFPVEE